MRVHTSPNLPRILITLAISTGFALNVPGLRAQAATALPARTSIVVFADRPLRDEVWAQLFEAVRRSVAEEQIQGLDGAPDFVRGDTLVPGREMDNPIVVFLHGDCILRPLEKRTAYAVPLGWVAVKQGQIEPFIHVDCTRIGQVIGANARGLNEEERNRMMARAVARVIVHEWIHVARQSREHGRSGITKAQFGDEDLVGELETHAARR